MTRIPFAAAASCTVTVFDTPFAAVAVMSILPRTPVGVSRPFELIVALDGSLTDQKIGVLDSGTFAAENAVAVTWVFELALYNPIPGSMESDAVPDPGPV